MSKYIAVLSRNRDAIMARNLFELQSQLCIKLKVSPTLLTYHLLRTTVLNRTKDRSRSILNVLGICGIHRAYKRVNKGPVDVYRNVCPHLGLLHE
jgi:hypothetical protein